MPPLTPMQQLVVDEANRQGIDPAVALSLAEQESNFEPRAVSRTGVTGLLQVTVPTGLPYGQTAGTRTDPQVSAQAGMMALRDNIKRAGSVEGGLKAYGDPKQTGFASQVLARVPKWRAVMAEQQPGATAEDVYRDMGPAGPATPAATAEDVYKAMETPQSAQAQAQAQAPYQGLTSSWWKDFTPEEAQALRPLIGEHPWLERLIQHSPDMAREFLYRSLITAGTTAGVMTGATAGTAVGPVYGTAGGAIAGGAGGAFLARKYAEELGIAPPGADPRQVWNPGTVAETIGGVASGLPLAVNAWAYGPGKQAIEAADALYQSKIADWNTGMQRWGAGRGPHPGDFPTYEVPTLKPGKLSDLIAKTPQYDTRGMVLTALAPGEWGLKTGVIGTIAGIQALNAYRRYALSQLTNPANYARLRDLGVSPLQTGLAAGAAQIAAQGVRGLSAP